MRKKVDTSTYIDSLRTILAQGKDVNLTVVGNSMGPFLASLRDSVMLSPVKKPLKKGDIVMFQRDNGEYVLHRICRVCGRDYFIVGDAQNWIEGPIRENQIFAIVTKAKRKDRWIGPGNFWWEFFGKLWIRVIPIRSIVMSIYRLFWRMKRC